MVDMERFYPCNRRLAEQLGISFTTLKRWIYARKIRAVKTVGRRYRIPESEILRICGQEPKPRSDRVILYARVSGSDQVKDGDLRRLAHLKQYAKDRKYHVIDRVKEVGSGLNDKRPKLRRLMKLLYERKADAIIVEYKDRLTRFGFNYLQDAVNTHGARIETVFDDIKKDATQELVEDMISIVQSFSARLYGRRTRRYHKVVGGLQNAVHVRVR